MAHLSIVASDGSLAAVEPSSSLRACASAIERTSEPHSSEALPCCV